ncbi:beta-ketoacyl-[acyl-carrier-protein] synthase family protein [Antrihabitans cavernicola]|uniref:Beta-ketoacyl-[acyl-carrier-protein] synthase family protein n=1 Tax=Antrihabitans cavernicola TaxID=2495913 RepID=A0A5A7S948_9NOCA|nr:beta-ketoacyl-[acyl-carrier-protein] synthase family protein [Spelaeibacter cavernicola]KAA0021672.1 beta-ketoacyl-[acyl-carrier-protein] synthase family protein [Spelaeibacter cavernicola]
MKQAVITGLGVVAPQSNSVDEYWSLLTSGRSATGLVTAFDARQFDSRIAAECRFDPNAFGLTPREQTLDRATQFAVAALGQALEDSGIAMEDVPSERISVQLGCAVGLTTSLEKEYAVMSDSGSRWEVEQRFATPRLYDHFVPSSLVSEVAVRVGASGACAMVSTGCTSGIDAIGHAVDLIRTGAADVVVSGGAEAPISPITYACFDAIHATSTRNDQADSACRPFSGDRDGLVLGEGAAVLIVEEYEHARARGATIYAKIGGYASRCNAHHMTGLTPDGSEMAAAITAALSQSTLAAESIGYVNAHGSGTKMNDIHETGAVKHALGDHAYQVPMSSIKSVIGHSLGAIGALETVACLLAMRHNVVPPTVNYTEPDPSCDLDYVPNVAREANVTAALTVGSGFGGFQSAMTMEAV